MRLPRKVRPKPEADEEQENAEREKLQPRLALLGPEAATAGARDGGVRVVAPVGERLRIVESCRTLARPRDELLAAASLGLLGGLRSVLNEALEIFHLAPQFLLLLVQRALLRVEWGVVLFLPSHRVLGGGDLGEDHDQNNHAEHEERQREAEPGFQPINEIFLRRVGVAIGVARRVLDVFFARLG